MQQTQEKHEEPSRALMKAMAIFENLDEKERGQFIDSINKNLSLAQRFDVWRKSLTSVVASTKKLVEDKLKISRFTKVPELSDSVAEQILDGEIHPKNIIQLTISSGYDMKEEISMQIGDLIRNISKELKIENIIFADIFYNKFPDVYMYLFTNEPDTPEDFMPEGTLYYDSKNVLDSYSAYQREVYGHELYDTKTELLKIFQRNFTHLSEQRLRLLIERLELAETILKNKKMLNDEKKFH